jgi:hypothetical protein
MATNATTQAITTNATFTALGDSVQARFLKQGDLVIGEKGRYFEIGIARCDSDTNVLFSVYNELGGIETQTWARDEFVPLLTAI